MRDRMRRYGTTDAREEVATINRMLAGSRPLSRNRRQPPPTKAELRAQAAAAFVAWRRQHAGDPPAPGLQGDRGATTGDVAPPWE
jgi:hypothetical protein